MAFRCGKNGKGKSIARPRQRRAGAGEEEGREKRARRRHRAGQTAHGTRPTASHFRPAVPTVPRRPTPNYNAPLFDEFVCAFTCARPVRPTPRIRHRGKRTGMRQLWPSYLLAGATTVANAIKPIGEITALYILSLFPLSMQRASREVLHKLIHAMYWGCVYIYIWMLDRR